jgi:hypothetical protein
MKTRYDAKVHSFQLEPGDYVLYYCPRRKRGRYQKWRRLCSICRVESRFNDILYSIRTTPRAKPILAHIDRLRRYEGEIPDVWKNSSKLARSTAEKEGNQRIQLGSDESASKVVNEPPSDAG